MAGTATIRKLKIREEVAALKRERTLLVAVELFYEKGFGNATLDDVAARLGVTKPFIYANFGSKSELLSEICLRGVRAAADTMDEALDMELGPADTLRIFAQRYVTAILDHQRYIAIYTREEKNLEPEAAERIAALRKAFVSKLAGLIGEGHRRGEMAPVDAEMAALAIVGAVSWSTFWYRPDGRLDAREIAQTMTGLIRSLVAPQEEKPIVESAA